MHQRHKLSREEQRIIDKQGVFNKYLKQLYAPEMIEGVDYITCPLCSERFRQLNSIPDPYILNTNQIET